MKKDFDMVIHQFGREVTGIRIYPIGDLHPESQEFRDDIWQKWKQRVLEDKQGYVMLLGDMLDVALKGSKTNSYEARMRPREAKEWLRRELTPIRDRILGVVRGNHEYRSVMAGDDCPLYDVMCKLDLEDLYRENACFAKISLGNKNKDRQFTYTMVLMHGMGKKKVEYFGYAIDGVDVFITGHLHTGESNFPAKIVIDPRNDVVKKVGFKRIIVPSMLDIGGYTLRNMYLPQDNEITPVIELSGVSKEVSVTWK